MARLCVSVDRTAGVSDQEAATDESGGSQSEESSPFLKLISWIRRREIRHMGWEGIDIITHCSLLPRMCLVFKKIFPKFPPDQGVSWCKRVIV